jgi:hypothetical protein
MDAQWERQREDYDHGQLIALSAAIRFLVPVR